MSEKSCAFQYATAYGVIIEDTGLITKEEAEALKDKHLADFKRRMELGEEPEMAIWLNMSSETDYRETSFHICADDLMLEGGVLYEVKKERIG